jgi:hypothetical protein
MESIIKAIAPYLTATDLILVIIIAWQFWSAWQKDKSVDAAFKLKDEKLVGLFSVLNVHTDAINKFLGFLDGQRRSI